MQTTSIDISKPLAAAGRRSALPRSARIGIIAAGCRMGLVLMAICGPSMAQSFYSDDINPGDLLIIRVPSIPAEPDGRSVDSASLHSQELVLAVDRDGNTTLPVFGELSVSDLGLDLIYNLLDQYYSNALNAGKVLDSIKEPRKLVAVERVTLNKPFRRVAPPHNEEPSSHGTYMAHLNVTRPNEVEFRSKIL